MADTDLDFNLQRGDLVTVTFNDATFLEGRFYRWYPSAEGVSCAVTVPETATTVDAVTGIHYIDDFRHILKLTPNVAPP